jgi:hypothetical protein
MKTVIKHLEYKIKSLSESVMQCNKDNKQFKEDWDSVIECGNYELVDKAVIKNYLSEITEYEQALAVLIAAK